MSSEKHTPEPIVLACPDCEGRACVRGTGGGKQVPCPSCKAEGHLVIPHDVALYAPELLAALRELLRTNHCSDISSDVLMAMVLNMDPGHEEDLAILVARDLVARLSESQEVTS